MMRTLYGIHFAHHHFLQVFLEVFLLQGFQLHQDQKLLLEFYQIQTLEFPTPFPQASSAARQMIQKEQ